jgi:hypothetical protein
MIETGGRFPNYSHSNPDKGDSLQQLQSSLAKRFPLEPLNFKEKGRFKEIEKLVQNQVRKQYLTKLPPGDLEFKRTYSDRTDAVKIDKKVSEVLRLVVDSGATTRDEFIASLCHQVDKEMFKMDVKAKIHGLKSSNLSSTMKEIKTLFSNKFPTVFKEGDRETISKRSLQKEFPVVSRLSNLGKFIEENIGKGLNKDQLEKEFNKIVDLSKESSAIESYSRAASQEEKVQAAKELKIAFLKKIPPKLPEKNLIPAHAKEALVEKERLYDPYLETKAKKEEAPRKIDSSIEQRLKTLFSSKAAVTLEEFRKNAQQFCRDIWEKELPKTYDSVAIIAKLQPGDARYQEMVKKYKRLMFSLDGEDALTKGIMGLVGEYKQYDEYLKKEKQGYSFLEKEGIEYEEPLEEIDQIRQIIVEHALSEQGSYVEKSCQDVWNCLKSTYKSVEESDHKEIRYISLKRKYRNILGQKGLGQQELEKGLTELFIEYKRYDEDLKFHEKKQKALANLHRILIDPFRNLLGVSQILQVDFPRSFSAGKSKMHEQQILAHLTQIEEQFEKFSRVKNRETSPLIEKFSAFWDDLKLYESDYELLDFLHGLMEQMKSFNEEAETAHLRLRIKEAFSLRFPIAFRGKCSEVGLLDQFLQTISPTTSLEDAQKGFEGFIEKLRAFEKPIRIVDEVFEKVQKESGKWKGILGKIGRTLRGWLKAWKSVCTLDFAAFKTLVNAPISSKRVKEGDVDPLYFLKEIKAELAKKLTLTDRMEKELSLIEEAFKKPWTKVGTKALCLEKGVSHTLLSPQAVFLDAMNRLRELVYEQDQL